jgi:hypothetical protein
VNTKNQPNEGKNHFPCCPFKMDYVAFKFLRSYIIKCIIWTFPNIDACITYPWKKIGINALFDTFLLFSLKWKLHLKQGFKLLKRTQNNNNIISNLFLDFFITLTCHHSSYSYILIHYNHEIINVMKIQNSHLQSFFNLFFIRTSFLVPWLWICPLKWKRYWIFNIFSLKKFN